MEPFAELAAAVNANDTARASQCLAAHPELGPRLNEPMPGGDFGGTLLLAAVNQRNREMIDFLLGAGADVNARSDWWAGSFGVLDVDSGLEDVLISRGAELDAHAAARLGRLAALRDLVAANPEIVHARGGDGQRPLHFAATVEIAEYLLDAGADIDARDVDHESTAAQWMIRDRQDVARFLVSRGGQTDVLMAAALGGQALVEAHLRADPSLIHTIVSERWFPKMDPRSGGTIYNWTIGTHKTAHLVAREFGHEHIVRLLLERGPATLKLSQACALGDEALVHELVTSDPGTIAALSVDEQAGLARAAETDRAESVRLMLAAGWPVDARGRHGGTALHWAGWNGNSALVREILRHGPMLELSDADYGMSALGWTVYASVHGWRCKTGDYVGAVEALLSAGAEPPAITDDLQASESVLAVLRGHAGRSAG